MGPGFIWIFLVCFIISCAVAENCKRESRCRISRVHGMKGADCFNQNIRNFPQCISSDIQILDLSQNRIRKLEKNDLKRYSQLKMLYLSDNIILQIHDKAFEDLTDLTTLDLSLNGLSKVPPLIFELPSLKTLYLSHNMNINIADTIEQIKSISSPLVSLDLSYISDEVPAVLPNLGTVPFLIKLNITGTDFEDMTPSHIAGLCNLKYLLNKNATVDFQDLCDCLKINRWLKERSVNFIPFKCEINSNECQTDISEADLNTFQQCKETAVRLERNSKIYKGLIYGGIVLGIVLLLLLVYIIFKRTNRIKPKKTEKNNQALLKNLP